MRFGEISTLLFRELRQLLCSSGLSIDRSDSCFDRSDLPAPYDQERLFLVFLAADCTCQVFQLPELGDRATCANVAFSAATLCQDPLLFL